LVWSSRYNIDYTILIEQLGGKQNVCSEVIFEKNGRGTTDIRLVATWMRE